MFRSGKILEELLEKVNNLLTEAERERIREEQSRKETGALLQRLAEEIAAQKEAGVRHDETIEDMLDEWSDWRGEQTEWKKALEHYTAKEEEAAAARGEELLKLLMTLHDQLSALHRAAEQAEDSNWTRQLTLSLETADAALFQSGLQVFGRPGEVFQYELHEAVSAVETRDPEADMRIASVLSCGWSDRGRILRRAKVTVYRYDNNHSI